MVNINSKFFYKIFKISIVSFVSVLVLVLGSLLLYEPNIPIKEKLYAIYSVCWGDQAYDDDHNVLAFEAIIDEFNDVVQFVESNYVDGTELTIFYDPQRENASKMADELYAALDNISRKLDVSSYNSFSRITIDKTKIVFGFDGNPIAYIYSRNGKKPLFLQECKPTRKKLDKNWYYFNINK